MAANVNSDYYIDKIEHFFRKNYQQNRKVYDNLSVSIKVTKLS